MTSKDHVKSRFIEADLDINPDASDQQDNSAEQQQDNSAEQQQDNATEQQQDEWEFWSDDEDDVDMTRTATMRSVTDENLKYLNTNVDAGLSDVEVKGRQKIFGKNMLKEERESTWRKIVSYFWGPIQAMIEVAAILAAALRKSTLLHNFALYDIYSTQVDMGVIIGLLVLNAVVGFLQEKQAGDAIKELTKELALKARVRRNGKITEVDATELVVGDIIHLAEGDVVPADAKVLGQGAFVQVDQSSITGESLPVRKGENDVLYSSSAIKRGEVTAIVVAIGDQTYIGHAASLVQTTKRVGHFSAVLNKMGKGLIFGAYICIFIVIIASYFRGADFSTIFALVAGLVVVAVPIALPAVITTTLAVGATDLARKHAVVRELGAIESLAAVDVLCTDKTGTLTMNKLKVAHQFIMEGTTTDVLFTVAALASQRTRKGIDAIDKSIMKHIYAHYRHLIPTINSYKVVEFNPFDPVSKRILVKLEKDGKEYIASKGAPQVILQMVQDDSPIDEQHLDDYNNAVNEFAKRGFRSIGVAFKEPDSKWQIIGIISLFDPPRHDTKETLAQALTLGLKVKMLTGDQLAIAKETARQLGLGLNIYDSTKLGLGTRGKDNRQQESSELIDFVENADGFAQVFPEHKYKVVDIVQKRKHIVAMTGDGVNDAPSLKKADVGIAVKDSSNAARVAASIVVMEAGLSVIIDAIKTSRRIFHRMESYVQFRVALSLHVLIYLTTAIIIFGKSPINLTMIVTYLLCADNDPATRYDRAPYSQVPVKWDMALILFRAFILGICLAVGTWVVHATTLVGPEYMGNTAAAAFLEVALSQNWTILSTRTGGGFWRFLPGWQLVLAILTVDIVASIMVIFRTFLQHHIDEKQNFGELSEK
ncbi:11266_t:CDS:10 [Paraglomus occultum]|uniref:Plasma membrane ATPase n=1 Tax=Paraglomus occultum TaxID=144539 RepID=A0A9N8WDH5_9GLOM|nr:11266_t:CDS:10 [Paraglomus occultum]